MRRRGLSGINYVLVLASLLACLEPITIAKVHVHITNRLRNETSLDIHCQSGDDDLGKQTLQNGAEMEWSFGLSIFGTTLFYCDVEWDEGNGYHFDAYSQARDECRCSSECRWLITEDGPIARNQDTGLWEAMPSLKRTKGIS